MEPDYSKYTYFELLDVLENVDSEKYPERVDRLRKELKVELVNINESIQKLGLRMPLIGIPSDDFLKEEEQPKTFLQKLTSVFDDSEKPVKTYGNIDASISGKEAGKYHYEGVSAYMVEEDGALNLVLRGEYFHVISDTLEVARIKVNASNISRLMCLLEKSEADIKSKNLTSGR